MICLLESAGVKCVSSHPGFEAVCLNAWVLEPAQVQYKQGFASEPIRSQKRK